MEILKKTILQAVRTGDAICTGCTGMCRYDLPSKNAYYIKYGCTKTKIVPILDEDYFYYFKIGLKQLPQDIGFFDAFSEPIPPEPPPPIVETYNFIQYNNDIYIEGSGDTYVWEL